MLGTILAGRDATDLELIPPSGAKFERLKIKNLPAYRAQRDPEGAYSRLTRPEIVAELRLITGLALNERGADLFPPALPRITCRYEQYSAVDHAWFLDISHWFREELRQLGLTYHRQSWDCDDYTMALNAFADLALLRAKDHPPPQLLGRLLVRQVHPWAGVPAGGVHELVIVRTGAGWHVLEPQNHTLVKLRDYPNRVFVREFLFN